MLKTKVPLYIAILAVLPSVALSLFLSFQQERKVNTSASVAPVTPPAVCGYSTKRLNGYEYVHPLLYTESNCESSPMISVKREVENRIEFYKVSGVLSSASVYLRDCSNGEWMSIDEEKKFPPGSLIKVPILISYCKMKEKNPELFKKRITYSQPFSINKIVKFSDKGIEVGHTYTVEELLKYMITYSDNYATNILLQNVDTSTFFKAFVDLGLNKPVWNSNNFPITSKDYSYFWRVLYNASYLGVEDSEYCIALLSTSNFSEGLVSGLPKGWKVAHKFGEGGDESSPCLSESGIIYLYNKAYILTVMTNGHEIKKLPGVIADISKVIFEKMNG